MKETEQHLYAVYSGFVDMESKYYNDHKKECHMDDLTECQCRYLRIIEANEPLTLSEFADLLKVTKPTVSQLLTKLIKGGYVEKETCPNDRRSCSIRVTEKGRKVATVRQTARIDVVRFIEMSLSENEINQLIELIDKLLMFNEEEI